MNPYFLPNVEEQIKIQLIQQYCRNEFALIRMTSTMLEKSIIDASGPLRTILKDNDTVTMIMFFRELNIKFWRILMCF
ncbi:Uncharacterised protein [Paenibacillus polymyxa]|nr:Uncharacterised protein [Paenibacillus polymyxa]